MVVNIGQLVKSNGGQNWLDIGHVQNDQGGLSEPTKATIDVQE